MDNKFSCDWIIGLTPTERIENMNTVLRAIEAAQSADEVLRDASFKTDWTTLEQVLEGPVYGRRFARYILFKLDFIFHGTTTPLNPPDTVSVEHILPQNPKPDSDWCRDFTAEQRMQYTDRIGNLVLISRKKNSTQGNLDYADKRTRYLKGYIETFSNSIRLLTSYDAWTPEQVQLNTRLILEKLKEHYST